MPQLETLETKKMYLGEHLCIAAFVGVAGARFSPSKRAWLLRQRRIWYGFLVTIPFRGINTDHLAPAHLSIEGLTIFRYRNRSCPDYAQGKKSLLVPIKTARCSDVLPPVLPSRSALW